MSKLLRISMTLLLAGSLIGCGANDEDDVADNNSATETTNTRTRQQTQLLTKQRIQM